MPGTLLTATLVVWGWSASPGWLLVWLLPLAAMAVWFVFASPRASYGGPVVRPAVKVLGELPGIQGLVPERPVSER